MLQSKYQQILHPIYGLSLLKYWLVHISYNKSEYSYVEGGGGGGVDITLWFTLITTTDSTFSETFVDFRFVQML